MVDASAIAQTATVTAARAPRGSSYSAQRRRALKEAEQQSKAVEARVGESAQAARTLVTLVETLGISLAGEGAAMQPAERELIETSLPHVLARMTPEVAAQVDMVTYPLMLGLGTLFYGLRVLGTLQARAAAQRRAAVVPPAVESAPVDANGEREQVPAADATPGAFSQASGEIMPRAGEVDMRAIMASNARMP